MSRLAAVNPQGRLDVLAYRLAERGAQRILPREWPLFAPHVERWAAKRLGPKALGDLTWTDLWMYTNPLTVAVAPTYKEVANTTYFQALMQSLGLQDTPSLPKSSSPVSQGPAAPITAAKMMSWSTADLAETEAQKGKQYNLDMNWIRANSSTGDKASSAKIPPLEIDKETAIPWLIIAAAAVGVVLLVRR